VDLLRENLASENEKSGMSAARARAFEEVIQQKEKERDNLQVVM